VNKKNKKNYYKKSPAKKNVKKMKTAILYFKVASLIAVVTLMSFMFIFGYDLMTQCDYFKAKSIVVTGNHILSEQDILEQSEINKNVNILSVNLSILQEKIRSNPWIEDAEVMRDLPDKLIINIKEQQPIAILDLGRKFFINASGKIFKETSASDPDNLPVVTGLKLSDINFPGETSSIAFSAVMSILQLGQEPNTILPNRLIKAIEVDREIGLTLHMLDDASFKINKIKLGYNNYQNKYDKLQHILTYLGTEDTLSGFNSIDLNNLNRIIVTPVNIEAPISNNKEI
jgi:cell division protein FtsQ